MMRRPAAPDVSFRGQIFFLVVGLVPLFMLVQFWLKSGTGLHTWLWGFMALLFASFLVAVNYFLFYREYKPRSALVTPGPFKALMVGGLLLTIGAFNMLGTTAGIGLTLSPGPKIEVQQAIKTYAGVLLKRDIADPPRKKLDLRKQRWLTGGMYLKGSLWGALGYALAFGLTGMLFGLLRKEVVDPRDEHIGTGAMGALVRGAVGLFYGAAMGFALGAVMIFVVRGLFPDFRGVQAEILHWIYVLGAATNPNVAFAFAFSTGSMMAGAMSLFLGSRDFTAPVSDPKAPELTRPVQVIIPPVPAAPQAPFDMSRVQAESQQILLQFGTELKRVTTGAEWEYEAYDLPPVGRLGQKAEPEATNLISARNLEEPDYDTAMGQLSNVYVQITADLGKLEISAADWLMLGEGAMLELPRMADNTVGIRINGQSAGRGKALTVNGNKAVKVTGLRGKVEQYVKA
jgi:flagellar motor switch/type III secretory pathway protein FliN